MSETAAEAAELEAARERLEAVEAEIDAIGEEAVDQAATAYGQATSLLESYADEATGTGRETFKKYVELEAKFARLVESLPEDFEGRSAFEDAREAIDKSRLSQSDFERATELLAPAERFEELLEERAAARRELRSARKQATRRLEELEDAIATRERLVGLADVDIDLAEAELREPIESYNDTVREGFRTYRQETSARDVFGLVEKSRLYPFVPFEQPPARLQEYVAERPAGEYTIPELLEYAGYSRSKLAHYVEDADELKRRVETERSYLQDLAADPLTIDWPPPDAGTLTTRTRELVPFVDRVAGSAAVAQLREVRELARRDDYDDLREAAAGGASLSDEERERLEHENVEVRLEELRNEREQLEDALES